MLRRGVGAGILAWLAVRAGGGSPDDADGWAAGVTIIVWLLNAVVIAAITNGQTLGKKVACIRTVRENGRRYGVGTALLRDVVCRLIFVIPLVWLIDSLMPLGEARQTQRDKMVSTRVMQEPEYRSRRWPLAIGAVALTAAWIAVIGSTDMYEGSDNYTGLDREVFING